MDESVFTHHNDDLTIFGVKDSHQERWATHYGINFCAGTPDDVLPITYDEVVSIYGDAASENTNGTQSQKEDTNQKTAAVQPVNQPIQCRNSISRSFGCKPFSIGAKAKTQLTYRSENKQIATVDRNGFISFKRPGKTAIIVTAKQTSEYKSAVKIIYVTSKLKRPLLKANNISGPKVRISWSKIPKASGYKIYICNPGSKNL